MRNWLIGAALGAGFCLAIYFAIIVGGYLMAASNVPLQGP